MARVWLASAILLFVAVTLLKSEKLNNRESGRWINSVIYQSISQLSPFEDVDNHVNDHVRLFHGYKKKLCRKLTRIFSTEIIQTRRTKICFLIINIIKKK